MRTISRFNLNAGTWVSFTGAEEVAEDQLFFVIYRDLDYIMAGFDVGRCQLMDTSGKSHDHCPRMGMLGYKFVGDKVNVNVYTVDEAAKLVGKEAILNTYKAAKKYINGDAQNYITEYHPTVADLDKLMQDDVPQAEKASRLSP